MKRPAALLVIMFWTLPRVEGSVPAGLYQVDATTARDVRTRLRWQRTSTAAGALAWDAAVTHCAELDQAGHQDWRLPTIKELSTILDETRTTAPAVDVTLFSDPEDRLGAGWWSSSGVLEAPGLRWMLDFGGTGPARSSEGMYSHPTADPHEVRCVRTE